MSELALPALAALFVWWFSTGVVLYLDGLPRTTYRWTMLGATALLAAALHGLAASSADATLPGAFIAFACALLAWGWQEIAFLTGTVTGPRREPCPAGCAGWRRFVLATGTVLWHELSILAMGAAIVALTWDGPNQIGTGTYLVLWGMRLSAKLNIFLGVRNRNEEFLPDHLRYLGTYFARRPMNPLFPVSIIASTAIAALLFGYALAPGADAFQAAGFTLLGTLMALAILEHWLMLLPLPATALWGWGFRSRATAAPPRPPLRPPHRSMEAT